MSLLKPPKRRRFYVMVYSLSGLIATVGLAFNTASISLNDNIQKLHRQIKMVRDQNRELKAQLLQETRWSKLDAMATELGMARPQTIIYIADHGTQAPTQTP